MNFYKRHIGDYLKDTAHLSLLEHGVYTRLLDVYYTRESGIPDDQAARLIGARGRDETAALKVVLAEFFELVDGTWIQDRCEREIRATGPTDGDGEVKPAKTGKALRQQAYRERRAALFEALRERGVTMPFKATMDELQDALLRVTKPAPVMPPVTGGVMPPVTDGPHNVTATISQTPDSTSQTPDVNRGSVIAGGNSPRGGRDDFTPKDEGEWLRHFKARHGFEADPTSIHDRKKIWPVFAGWVNAGFTAEFVDKAVATAIASAKGGIGCLPVYVDRVIASQSQPPRLAPDEQRRAISKANGDAWLAEDSQSDPNVIDMEH